MIPANDSSNRIGWLLGWIEENKHPYFFVVNYETADKIMDLKTTGVKLLKEILKQQGFFEGRM